MGEKTLIELGRLFTLRLGIVGDDAAGELFKKAARGQEHGGAEDVEDRVCDGDARMVEDSSSSAGAKAARTMQKTVSSTTTPMTLKRR